jgi:hypothetical protein
MNKDLREKVCECWIEIQTLRVTRTHSRRFILCHDGPIPVFVLYIYAGHLD